MLLNKTALAHRALQSASTVELSLLERRILIVTDGKRTLNDVMALLGAGILPSIDRLLKDGYIRPSTSPSDSASTPVLATPRTPQQGVAGAVSGLLRATTEAVQVRTEQLRASIARPMSDAAALTSRTQPIPDQIAAIAPPSTMASAQPSPAPTPTARSGQRRSLVAAKMYMIDMLQLQRHADAVELKVRVQFANGQSDLLHAIFDSLRILQQLTNASYGQRIITRLAEVLPEEFLPALDHTIAELRTPQLKQAGR